MSMRTLFSRTGVAAGTLAAALVTAGAASASPAESAHPADGPIVPQASCGATVNPSTGRGYAHWDVTCHNGEVTISGYVKHRGGPGCAYVKAVFEGQITHTSGKSCGFWGGSTVRFQWTHPGSIADAYLTET